MPMYNAEFWPILLPGPVVTVDGVYTLVSDPFWPNATPPAVSVVPGVYPLVVPPLDTTAKPLDTVSAPYVLTPAESAQPNATTYVDSFVTAAQTRDFFGIIQNSFPPSSYPPVPSTTP